MPRSIGVEAGFPRGEGGSLRVLGGRGDGRWARERQDSQNGNTGQECTFLYRFWGETGMDALQEEDKWYGGSCLTVGGRKGNPHSREAGAAHRPGGWGPVAGVTPGRAFC